MSKKLGGMTPLERLLYEKQLAEKCLQLDMLAMDKIEALNHRHPAMKGLNIALRMALRREIEIGKREVRTYEARIKALQPKLI